MLNDIQTFISVGQLKTQPNTLRQVVRNSDLVLVVGKYVSTALFSEAACCDGTVSPCPTPQDALWSQKCSALSSSWAHHKHCSQEPILANNLLFYDGNPLAIFLALVTTKVEHHFCYQTFKESYHLKLWPGWKITMTKANCLVTL